MLWWYGFFLVACWLFWIAQPRGAPPMRPIRNRTRDLLRELREIR